MLSENVAAAGETSRELSRGCTGPFYSFVQMQSVY
jgi:hypothetical protein